MHAVVCRCIGKLRPFTSPLDYLSTHLLRMLQNLRRKEAVFIAAAEMVMAREAEFQWWMR
jgi:hypothetical protein